MSVLYSEIRSEIKTGDLIAWNDAEIDSFFGFVLYLYQKILKANYTHVGVALRIGGRIFIVEATPPEVRLIPLKMTSDFYHIKANVKANPQNQIKFLLATLGTRYSLWDMVKAVFKLGRSNNDFYCSELAGHFYNEFGHLTDRDVGFSPDTIVNAMVKHTGNSPVKVTIDKANVR